MSVRKFFVALMFFTIILSVVSGGVVYILFGGGIFTPTSGDDDTPQTGRVNILVMGTDHEGANSDTIMFASLDNDDKKLDILSIPRDTYVKIRGGYNKINAAFPFGCWDGDEEDGAKLAVEVVEDTFNVDIDYYLVIDTVVFREIVDLLGGVDFDIPSEWNGEPLYMDYEDPEQDLYIHLKPGFQHLDGDKAEQLVRFRYGYPDADLGRIKMQQDFMKALMEQKLNLSIVPKLSSIYSVVRSRITTNIDDVSILKYAFTIKNLQPENVKTHNMPGEPEYIDEISYVICDFDATNQLMVDYFGAVISGYTKTPEPSPQPTESPSVNN